MDKIATPLKTAALLKAYGVRANKGFGQNFLISNHVIDSIVETAGITADDFVLEIGPGLGSLTQALCERAGRVVAVEIDKKFAALLETEFKTQQSLTIIQGDILKTDLHALLETYSENLHKKVCANLPYYVTTPIMMALLESRLGFESITIMIQKEVGERIVAEPGTKNYGALTLAVNYYARPEIAFMVPPGNFMPKPDVMSCVMHLNVRSKPPVAVQDEKLLFRVIKASFGQRRKTLSNCLYNQCGLGLSKEAIQQILIKCGFDPNIRGEKLGLGDFAVVADAIFAQVCQ